MEHVLMRIWHLQGMIQEAINTEDAQVRKSRLDKCLEYHNHVFLLAADVDRIYQRSLFVHVLFSGVLFGIMGFSILTVGISVKTLSLFVVWVCAAIFSSLSAQRLYDGSIAIGEEVYNSKWYDRDYKFQRDLITIMKRTQKPITIHAGPFAEISNVFILTIFKTAYSYLTLLKASNN
ncbi:Putative odorant receptor 85d-like Protein [Tribolium castaneum]|uniref:Odorant receptor 85d-like Protein n=2 Tax=Tribolium castaneum TaxID=7070 RepID=A0A139WBL7_TRICA|nr:Putative odorant receptor 85d-like Protein [Tribolium castaneum]